MEYMIQILKDIKTIAVLKSRIQNDPKNQYKYDT